MTNRLIALLFLFFLTPGMVWASGTARLKQFAQTTQSARAAFEQKVLDRSMRTTQQVKGTMQFSRPGKFRWAYDAPYDQLIVGDGKKLWFYDKDLDQVTVKELGDALGSSPAALLAGNNEIEKFFVLKDVARGDGLEWLEATPRNKESSFESIRMGFNSTTLDTMELKDNFGQTTVIRFFNFERNPSLKPDLFQFVPPKGADVIRG